MSKCSIEKHNEKAFNKSLKEFRNKLGRMDLTVVDVTFLHSLVPVVCFDKMAHPLTREYNKRLTDPSTLEHNLKSVKDTRNDICHDEARAVQDYVFDQLKTSILNCLEIAAQNFSIDDLAKQEKVREVNEAFAGIINDTTSTPERLVQFIRDWLISDGRDEIARTVRESVPLADNYSVIVPVDDIFYELQLSCRETSDDKLTTHKISFKCFEIFRHIHENIAILYGEAGSGKTTLIRKMFCEFLKSEADNPNLSFTGVNRFALPLFIECRSENSSSLVQYLKNIFNKQLYQYTDSVVLKAIDCFEGIAFFIDGIDEANRNCQDLIEDVVKYCKTNKQHSFCFITSRVEAGSIFEAKLSMESVKSSAISIEKIVNQNEQIGFLKKYCNSLHTNNSNQLVDAFSKVLFEVQNVFSTPIMLSLFCRLALEDQANVTNTRNIYDVYSALYESYERRVENLIRVNNWTTGSTSFLARRILHTFCQLSLRLWRRGSFKVEVDDIDKLYAEWQEEGRTDDINYDLILSCILSPEFTFRYRGQKMFQFPHLSIQEFMAAKAVVRSFLDDIDWDIDDSAVTVQEDRYAVLLKCIGQAIQRNEVKAR